ncbi:hypothetical protein M2M59_14755 [Rummeliibacillus sp. G93]|uniref:hypothetical protein n=1 Tax=Rummeliibacillus TaxID=648802 RepID=UPI0016807668|nr:MULTISPECIES: hypothetical protein [unclassified Rummeliibacillus]UQW97158.1 hypothetical protein M2M59_14755 [Rummeliibacillus sp. G93]
MSGKKMTFLIIGIVLVCLILIYLSIATFFKNNPHQPNQTGHATELHVDNSIRG